MTELTAAMKRHHIPGFVAIAVGVVLIALAHMAPALAADWPADAKMRMQAAGARLSAATDTAQRVDALREIEQIAKAYPDAPDARLMATLVSQKATMEAGPGVMLEALGEMAAADQITDAQSYASIVGPLLDTVGKMQEDGTLFGEAAIQLDNAVKKLNSVAAKAGLPSIADAISEASGDSKLGAAVTDTISRVATLADIARKSPDLAKMNEEETRAYLDKILSLVPASAGPAFNSPAADAFRDTLVWNHEMYGESSKALNLVTDAMETGRFNHEAYGKIRDRLNELAKGPWRSSNTAKDFFKRMCKAIPIAGAWCDDVFKAVEEMVSGVDCDQVTCDCENVGGGLMRGPLIVQCKLQEQTLIGECKATKKVVSSCPADAKGPGASH